MEVNFMNIQDAWSLNHIIFGANLMRLHQS